MPGTVRRMRTLRLVATAAGLVANLVFAYGTYRYMGCYQEGCPTDAATTYFFIGLTLSVLACFLSFPLLIGTMSLAIGLGALAVTGFVSDPLSQWLGAGTGIPFTLLGVAVVGITLRARRGPEAVAPDWRSQFPQLLEDRPAVDPAALLASGRAAAAVVRSVADTGVAVGNDPRVRLAVRLEPLDGGPPVDAERQTVLPRLCVPRPGDRLPALYDDADPDRFMLVTHVGPDTPRRLREVYAAVPPVSPVDVPPTRRARRWR
jgi:hypothetical protein